MPQRILRDWTDSDRMNQLTGDGERFFTRLIMKADDYGRYHADPRRLNAYLFPLNNDISEADCTRWLAECEKVGLVYCYEVAAKRYLEIANFRQRLRQMKAMYPSPPTHVSNPPSDDRHLPASCTPEVEEKGREENTNTNARAWTDASPEQELSVTAHASNPPPPLPAHHDDSHSEVEGKRIEEKTNACVRVWVDALPGQRLNAHTAPRVLQKQLNLLYRRSETDPWTYAEQSQLAEIARRPEALAEMEALAGYRRRLPGNEKRFFPNSIGSLLAKWTDALDKARISRPEPIKSNPLPQWSGQRLTEEQRQRLAAQLKQTRKTLFSLNS